MMMAWAPPFLLYKLIYREREKRERDWEWVCVYTHAQYMLLRQGRQRGMAWLVTDKRPRQQQQPLFAAAKSYDGGIE